MTSRAPRGGGMPDSRVQHGGVMHLNDRGSLPLRVVLRIEVIMRSISLYPLEAWRLSTCLRFELILNGYLSVLKTRGRLRDTKDVFTCSPLHIICSPLNSFFSSSPIIQTVSRKCFYSAGRKGRAIQRSGLCFGVWPFRELAGLISGQLPGLKGESRGDMKPFLQQGCKTIKTVG